MDGGNPATNGNDHRSMFRNPWVKLDLMNIYFNINIKHFSFVYMLTICNGIYVLIKINSLNRWFIFLIWKRSTTDYFRYPRRCVSVVTVKQILSANNGATFYQMWHLHYIDLYSTCLITISYFYHFNNYLSQCNEINKMISMIIWVNVMISTRLFHWHH